MRSVSLGPVVLTLLTTPACFSESDGDHSGGSADEGAGDQFRELLGVEDEFAILKVTNEDANVVEGSIDMVPARSRTRAFELALPGTTPDPDARADLGLIFFLPGFLDASEGKAFEQFLLTMPHFGPYEGPDDIEGKMAYAEWAFTEGWRTLAGDDRAEVVAALDELAATEGAVRATIVRDRNRYLFYRHQTTSEVVVDDHFCAEKVVLRYRVVFSSPDEATPIPPALEGVEFEFENLHVEFGETPFTRMTRITKDPVECRKWLDEAEAT
jgi:hypothetical protein